MPSTSLRPCTTSGCPTLTRGGPCEAHQQAPWKRHGDQVERLRGRQLQRAREQLFAKEPLCRRCAANRISRAATIRDHVVPLAEGGQEVESNVQPLCQRCSDEKTATESQRGRQRSGVAQ